MTGLSEPGDAGQCCLECGQPLGYRAVDRLTGLLDRWGWDEQAARAVATTLDRKEPLALLLLDLDRFKAINDEFGHLAGDTVLRAAAETLQRVTRRTDLLGRYGGHGGDEFLAMLPKADRDGAAGAAARIRDAIKAMRVSVPDATRGGATTIVRQTVSIGLAVHLPERSRHVELEDLLLNADAALLEAKREGRDRIRLAA